MQIRLNREPLDVTLENEKVLADVIDELFRLIQEAGFRITKVEHNGEELTREERDSWAHLPIEHIGTIDISAGTMRETLYEHLGTVRQFLSTTLKAYEKKNTPLLEDLASDYPAVRDSIDSLVSNHPPISPQNGETATRLSKILDEQIRSHRVFSDNPVYENSTSFSTHLDSILSLISERMREVSAPAEELKKTAEALKAGLDGISDVSLLLQTGKDREAMGTVLTFIELVSKIIRLYPLLLDESDPALDTMKVGDKGFKDFYTDFNNVLKELIEAFTINDSVLIGDLLEYEIVPRLEELLPSLEVLLSRKNSR